MVHTTDGLQHYCLHWHYLVETSGDCRQTLYATYDDAVHYGC